MIKNIASFSASARVSPECRVVTQALHSVVAGSESEFVSNNEEAGKSGLGLIDKGKLQAA
jgi:hypothetical protein